MVANAKQNDAIELATMYRNILFITPKISDNPQDTELTEARVKQSRNTVSQAIKSAGIKTDNLVIVNTADPF